MVIFVAALLAFVFAVAALALGVLTGRPPLRGSCGGVGRSAGHEAGCVCERPCPRRRRDSGRAPTGDTGP